MAITTVTEIAAEIREFMGTFVGVTTQVWAYPRIDGTSGFRDHRGMIEVEIAIDTSQPAQRRHRSQVVHITKKEGRPFEVNVPASGPMFQADAQALERCLTLAHRVIGTRLDLAFARMADEFLARGIGVGGG